MVSVLLAALNPKTVSEDSIAQGFTDLMLACEVRLQNALNIRVRSVVVGLAVSSKCFRLDPKSLSAACIVHGSLTSCLPARSVPQVVLLLQVSACNAARLSVQEKQAVHEKAVSAHGSKKAGCLVDSFFDC